MSRNSREQDIDAALDVVEQLGPGALSQLLLEIRRTRGTVQEAPRSPRLRAESLRAEVEHYKARRLLPSEV